MIKRILILIFVLGLVVYLGLSITVFNSQPVELACTDIEFKVKDSIHGGFIAIDDINTLLKNKKIHPVNRLLADISTKEIEIELQQHPLIDEVECYKTPSGKIGIEVRQRIPLLRVMTNSGEYYFVDNKGEIMPLSTKCIAHIAIATGNISKEFATKDLYQFAKYIDSKNFWSDQIEQIHVVNEKEVELVPRVGNHIVILGNLEEIEDKLKRLKVFYEKVLNQVGWNKYSKINVEFSNQVICTKVNL